MLIALLAAAPAFAFNLVDSTGKAQTLAQYKGKWVLVNYWATWCPPCLMEIPDLIALHENKKNNLVVLGVAVNYQSADYVKEFAEQMMISYPVILGDRKVIAAIGPVRGLPTTYLYNPQGKQVASTVGPVTRAQIEEYIANYATR